MSTVNHIPVPEEHRPTTDMVEDAIDEEIAVFEVNMEGAWIKANVEDTVKVEQ